MCGFAIIMTNWKVRPYLLAGPEDGSICGPFNRDSPDFGVNLGEGFDIKTHSHLQELFGFSNICVNWDYSPSRELTAMVYPSFEYLLLLYLVFDFMATALAWQRGELARWFWYFSKVAFAVNLFLTAQFRMIFVCIAYENPKQHTAGFLGLQMVLVLVALQNSGFVWETKTAYSFFGGDDFITKLNRTRTIMMIYLICTLAISAVKIAFTIHVVQHGFFHKDYFAMQPSGIGETKVGQVVDAIWMTFNAVIPLFLSFLRSREDEPLHITVAQEQFYAVPDEEEGSAMLSES